MNLSVFIVSILISSIYFSYSVNKYIHILQLNSYMNERYLRWANKSFKKIFHIKEFLPLGVLVIFNLLVNIKIASPLWSLSYLALFLFRSKVRQKKKLVYTARVKRLIAILCVLYLVLVGFVYNFFELTLYALIAISLLNILAFVFVMAGNTLAMPFEKLLSYFYYMSGRRIIKGHKSLKVIGITGSYGKTSTKHIVEKILSKKYNVLMTPGSYNTTLGVVITIRKSLNALTEIFIVEMGAKKKGDIKEICNLVEPDIGILTSIGPQHLETFKSIDNVINTKYELLDSLKEDGIGIINFDNEFIRDGFIEHRKAGVEYIDYGTLGECTIRGKDIRFTGRGMEFTVSYQDEKYEFTTKLLGKHNINNILAGITIGFRLGIDYKSIYSAIKELPPIEHRLEMKQRGNYFVIDDAFNSNPVGAEMALEVLHEMEGNHKIIITPGMIELGELEAKLNMEFGERMASICDYVILVGEKQTKPIQEGLKLQSYEKERIFIASDIFDAFQILGEIVQENDIVLIENDLPDNYNE